MATTSDRKVTLWIDDTMVTVPEGTTVLNAAHSININVPSLCYHPDLSVLGACRVCLVEIEGQRNPIASCSFAVGEGMRVQTSTPLLRRLRRDVVELILDNHPMDCQTCVRNGTCELQKLAYDLGVRERLFEGDRKRHPIDVSSPVHRNPEKCILCGRCVRVCGEVQGVHNLWTQRRGFRNVVAPANERDMIDSVCIHCGQCVNVCPTAAFTEQDATEAVLEALSNPELHVVVHTAPAIRATVGEGFGFRPGTPVAGKLVTALRRAGFDKVFDTNFGADLTVVEESAEFVARLHKKENLRSSRHAHPAGSTSSSVSIQN